MSAGIHLVKTTLIKDYEFFEVGFDLHPRLFWGWTIAVLVILLLLQLWRCGCFDERVEDLTYKPLDDRPILWWAGKNHLTSSKTPIKALSPVNTPPLSRRHDWEEGGSRSGSPIRNLARDRREEDTIRALGFGA